MTSTSAVRVVCMLAAGCLAVPAFGDDWPTYRHDARRSAASAEALRPPLSEEWVFTPARGPSRAWGDPQPKPVEGNLELPRLRFDDAFHVAAAGDRVFFGSSSEYKVVALDARTGAVAWEFLTEGPVRLAPTVAGGKVYFGSDDGRAYCVAAADGRPIWTFAAAPSPERVIGNGRVISLWPVRTGVLVDGGAAYFGAGVFPAEGLYLYAVGADDGKLIWKNDSYGQGGNGTVSPQGQLLASADRLFVPSGRAMPAGFSRTDGQFLFHRALSWRDVGHFGGTDCLLAAGMILTFAEQVVGASEADGRLALAEGLRPDQPSPGTHRLVVDGDSFYLATGKEILAADTAKWIAYRKSVRGLESQVAAANKQRIDLLAQAKLKPQLQPQVEEAQKRLDKAAADLKAFRAKTTDGVRWRIESTHCEGLALARGMLVVGGADVVVGLDPADGKQTWSAPVRGKARGPAVAGGRLFVSTDSGAIHCFIQGKGGKGRQAAPAAAAEAFPKDAQTEALARAAERIVREAGASRGYGLVLGPDAVRLAAELARRTELEIHVAEPDGEKAAAARKALSAAGLYGARVVVTQADIKNLPYPDYFANLIACQAGGPALAPEELLRMLKPCGGVACLNVGAAGQGGALRPDQQAAVRKALDAAADKATTVAAAADSWTKVARGPLPGAGAWTHEYAEPGNTACSDDRRVRGPVGILWFGEPGPGRMVSRHASAASPLAAGGRLFVQGENVVMAYDAYNGLFLWERQMPGALRTGLKTQASNLAASDDSLFVAVGDQVHRLDAATGRTVRSYKAPRAADGTQQSWHYLACAGGLLYGTVGPQRIFAVELDSGKVRWTHDGTSIQPITIAIGAGRVFFVDQQATPQQVEQALKEVPSENRRDSAGRPVKPDVRLAVALDAQSGRKAWERPLYVSDCVTIGSAGGQLTAMYADGVLLLCAQPWNGHFWKEFLAGAFSRRSLIALAADDGRMLWSDRKGYRSRPLIVENQIIAEPWAYDLRTGAQRERRNPITGVTDQWQMARPGHHCGNIGAAPGALFFRSGSTAYYDLADDSGTAHFGAQRPGCWINCIPACGLVLMPEAASGCMCPFAVHTTIAFAPKKTGRTWSMFSAPGPALPVRRLAVNFGAPGDRRASDGTLWLAYPRPIVTERLVLDLKFDAKLADGGGWFCRDVDFARFAGTADPWLFACGARGLARCAIPLAEAGAPSARYTVRLLFAESENDKAGRRVFDVKLQGRDVLTNFDIFKESGGAARALVRELKGVEAADSLVLELLPRTRPAGEAAMPVVSGIEIVRE